MKHSRVKYAWVPVLAYRKCGDLEEELKNVTNNLKSLEAQSEKVGFIWSVFQYENSIYNVDMYH